MQEPHLVLIFFLTTVVVVMLCWLALFSLVHAKGRIIRTQREMLEAERRLRLKHDAFTQNAHHELRTPLQVISGNLEMLRLMDPSPDQEKVIAQAIGATQRLTTLVQRLLDLAALADGTLKLHPALTNLGTHFAVLARDFGQSALAKGLGFEARWPPMDRPVLCDAQRLEQIVACLLDNAVAFTPRGSIHFRVEGTVHAERCALRIEVEDTGIGLPDDWARLLQPFEQGDASLTRARCGLGVGLPMVAGLVALMHGRLGFERLPIGTLAWVEVDLETRSTEALG
ncbi:MAG TPA: HAMP domain-containing sensor histidine kinase [Holophaga sp.]|nr:HAMP domain-containing sensor histidine kinase [Holophaga sp.]